MAKLKEKGLEDDTLVVFTSVHEKIVGAPAAQCHKGTPQDVSVRIPLIMLLPGRLPPGSVSEMLFGALDLPPTLLGLMGCDVPASWHGRNLARAIRDGDDDAVESVPIFNFRPSWRGVYTRRYTFAFENIERTPDIQSRFGSDLPGRRRHTHNHNVLYDRESDPLQLQNLVNSTEHIPLAMELTQATHDWCNYFKDPFLSYRRMIGIMGEREATRPSS